MTLFVLNILLALVWAGITVNYTVLNLLFGFVLGTTALFLVRNQFEGTERYFRRSGRVLNLVIVFIYELLLSGVRVALFSLRPKLDFQPGIVAIPLSTQRDGEVSLLANMVTLTPGTLSVDISGDKRTLYVHAIDADDPDELRRSTKQVFEARIMRAFR